MGEDTESSSRARFHAVVNGRVQGVGFRAYTQKRAAELGLTGWVRNRNDGTVEVVAEGEQGALHHLLNWLNQGPALASVDTVNADWEQPQGTYKSFSVRYTE